MKILWSIVLISFLILVVTESKKYDNSLKNNKEINKYSSKSAKKEKTTEYVKANKQKKHKNDRNVDNKIESNVVESETHNEKVAEQQDELGRIKETINNDPKQGQKSNSGENISKKREGKPPAESEQINNNKKDKNRKNERSNNNNNVKSSTKDVKNKNNFNDGTSRQKRQTCSQRDDVVEVNELAQKPELNDKEAKLIKTDNPAIVSENSVPTSNEISDNNGNSTSNSSNTGKIESKCNCAGVEENSVKNSATCEEAAVPYVANLNDERCIDKKEIVR